MKRGKHTAVKGKGQKRFIRFRTLGTGYGEDEIKAVLEGKAKHKPYQKKPPQEQSFQLLVDRRKHCLLALRTVKLPFQSSRVIFLGRSPAEEHLPGIIQAKECMKKKKHISMVSLNLPPAPLRKGNIQALDLHHSIGLSATPSSL